MDEFQIWLQSEFERICRRNPAYSVRSLAKRLKMDPSTVSQLLRGKRRASPKLARRIASELQADLTIFSPSRTGLASLFGEAESYSFLEDRAVAVLANWYYAAILESTFIKGFKGEPGWIAKKIGIPREQVHLALAQLIELGLLTKDSNGRLKKTNKHLTNFRQGQTSAARKELQKSIVEMAVRAIHEVKQEDKDITAMTMAIDKKNLDKARLCIQRFRREIAGLLEAGDPSEVYHLAVQLYPVNFNE